MSLSIKFYPVSFRLFKITLNHKRAYSKCNAARMISQRGSMTKNIFLISTALAFLWPVKRANKQNHENQGAKVPSVLEISDNLFENGHYNDCYKLLSSYEDQNNVEVQWRICRALYNMSKQPKHDKSSKEDMLFLAYEIISNELNNHPEHYAVHKWYAILLDARSSYIGIKERIKQLENVKKHMDLALILNPNDATLLHMLGEWCYQISDMPWHHRRIAEILFASPPHSTYEDALEYFMRAETVQPRFYSLNLLRLGNCYLKLKKEDQAKYYLQLAASYPAKSNDDHAANKEAAELLKKLK